MESIGTKDDARGEFRPAYYGSGMRKRDLRQLVEMVGSRAASAMVEESFPYSARYAVENRATLAGPRRYVGQSYWYPVDGMKRLVTVVDYRPSGKKSQPSPAFVLRYRLGATTTKGGAVEVTRYVNANDIHFPD